VIDDLRQSWLAKFLLPLFLLSFAWKVWRVSKECNVLHVQWVPTILVALPARFLRNLPIIVNVRTNPDTAFWRGAFRLLMPKVSYVIYNSENTRRLTEMVMRHPRSSVIGSGIDTLQFERPSDLKKRPRRSRPLKLIVVARLVEFKGVEFLIRALPIVQKELQVQLSIHGDGPLRSDLERLVEELELDGTVSFRGETPHEMIPNELWGADIFLLPSIVDSHGRTEGFGAVILEAMVAGLPVIASRVGGIVDIVNESNGVLVEPKNVPQLADAICALATDDNRRERLAQAGKKWAKERFSEDSICDQYRAIYESVLKDVA